LPVQARKSSRLEDPGAELLDRARSVWEVYGKASLIGLGAVAAIGAIAFLAMRARGTAETTAAGKLGEANVLYWEGDYARSLETARQIAQQYVSSPSGWDAHRLAGDDAYMLGDTKTAVSEYRAYLEHQKSGLLADAARRSLAYALEANGQYAEAATSYLGLVGRFDRESSAEFLSAAARCYRAARQPAEAAKVLRRLMDEFGDTSFANRAEIGLGELSNAAR